MSNAETPPLQAGEDVHLAPLSDNCSDQYGNGTKEMNQQRAK